jgi:diaminopimelate epimerase
MRFTKMHGLGNDYLFLDAVREPAILLRPDLAGLTRAMCDRNEGAGADGVIIVSRPEGLTAVPGTGDTIAMRILNADGSDGGMCGNGARCVCKLAVERGHVMPGEGGRVDLVVDGRTLKARVFMDAGGSGEVVRVEIDMGEPVLDLPSVPVDDSRLGKRTDPLHPHEHYVDGHAGVFVNMGNPHFLIFTQHDPDMMADRIGPSLETHPAFPKRMNVQIVRIADDGRLVLRTWERGTGRTRACGTGACAAVVAGVLTNRCYRAAEVSMLGGTLDITWPERTGRVSMTGPATLAFDGEWPESLEDLCAVCAKVIPTLRTARLVLRPHGVHDLPDLERSISDFETARFTRTWPHPYPAGENGRFLRRISASACAGESCGWAITEASGTYVGSIGLRIDVAMKTAEVGYSVMKPFTGRGYCTEALAAVVKDGFERLKLRKIDACYYTTNPASGRILEKCGFVRAGERKKHAFRFGEVLDLIEMDLVNPAG